MARTPRRRRRGGSPQEDTAFTGRSEEESLVAPPSGLPTYRLITGKDDATFCERVSEALKLGYRLHGSPAVTFNGTDVIAAQAVLWPLFFDFEDDGEIPF